MLKLESPDKKLVLPRLDEWSKGYQAKELQYFLKGIDLPKIRFYDLRASWVTMLFSKGIPPIKVMSMGGWKDLKTMQIYIRKAGPDISGITDTFSLFNPREESKVLKMFS